jgi:hypothetical protein
VSNTLTGSFDHTSTHLDVFRGLSSYVYGRCPTRNKYVALTCRTREVSVD